MECVRTSIFVVACLISGAGWAQSGFSNADGAAAVSAARRYVRLAYAASDLGSVKTDLRAAVDCLSPEKLQDKGIVQQLQYARNEGVRGLGESNLTSARMDALAALDYLQSVSTGSADAVGSSSAFRVTSPTLADGDFISRQDAATAQDCGGQDISPPIHWSNAPSGTRSFAVTVFDPDGDNGLGYAHWVAYDIPSSVSLLPRGAGDTPSRAFVGGVNSKGTSLYSGPCPPAGAQPHHYIISVYALDLAPGRLKPGLERDAFLRAIRGHSLAEASIVVRYAR